MSPSSPKTGRARRMTQLAAKGPRRHSALFQVLPGRARTIKVERPERLTLTFEISRACNLNCQFCYNPWKIAGARGRKAAAAGVPDEAELPTERALRILGKAIDESGATEVTLSGGEPLLREDLADVIRFLKKKKAKVAVVTNGTLLTKEVADRYISEGVDLFQVSLLSDRQDIHNELAGRESFHKVIEGIINVRNLNGTVFTFFAGTSRNIATFRGALELNVLLGVKNVALGRFVPGGKGVSAWRRLLPDPESLQAALDSAGELAKRYPIAVTISTPILPCLVDLSKHENVTPGFCTVGRRVTFFTIDPVGNIKVCSHSSHSLGNILERPFGEIVKGGFIREFVETVPEYCADCEAVTVCGGGCRSSAHLLYGSFEEEDPYLRTWKARADKHSPAIRKLMVKASKKAR